MADTLYRWRCGLRNGPWRRDKHAVESAAVNHGLGWWSDYLGKDGKPRLVYGPLLAIDSRTDA